jgi:putative FmdB family regulatory protein
MPFYEYICTHCGAATEILQKLSDPPATHCPKCHTDSLSKQISAAGFRLKGGGWYETDFKSEGQRNLVNSGGESATADAGKATAAGKVEAAKPAAESKPAESKAAEAKPAESKVGDSKPSAGPAPAPASTT